MRALALLLLLLSTPLAAAEVHVMPGAGTLGAAIAAAEPGDVLVLSGGAYMGPVTIDRTLTLTGDGTATIDGQGNGTVITIAADDVALTGLHVTGSGADHSQIDSGIKIVKGADRARIEGNRLTDNLHGVDVHGGLDALVRGNTVEGRQSHRMNERGNGFYVWNSPGTVIEGNRVRWGRDGIFSNVSKKGTYRGNTFRDLRFAVHYMYTHDSEVSGNVSIGNHLGFAIMFSDRVVVRDNLSLGDREHGVMLNFANSADVAGNLVRGGTKKCLFIYNAHKNLIFRNRFEGCGIGIHFTAGSERNMLTENTFLGNNEQVKYVGTRHMEWSFEGRGNFWSDHPAFDLNGDGIADGVFRPNDLMDHILWSQPAAALLTGSPAVQLVRWSQSSFPAILPGGVTDSHPLMQPHLIPVPDDITAIEAEVSGRWTKGTPDDLDLDDLGSH
ncbi:nitrous oxide reductase family maturation protein NosD [Frigidibacter albus]|uniref:Nitrous oxide reductase family maturation protein NosD n=1 Tax=Frigidibacter albus TaxID=1465486 RepID=A0A6L8VDU8_9RHOB|nr:nitrous oxide reductase family maturation protein NosD [Frigidibacter albus]MZQ88423.1 nitrous oxide reductase family maturation protein NosD [Frigidibacter albus]NBE29903.1 nitrous oxide reductase family maturation protein NosD [Frigidibacter albus]GGH45462.1 carbohydrate-binding protein [Frigidibacter albus]